MPRFRKGWLNSRIKQVISCYSSYFISLSNKARIKSYTSLPSLTVSSMYAGRVVSLFVDDAYIEG